MSRDENKSNYIENELNSLHLSNFINCSAYCEQLKNMASKFGNIDQAVPEQQMVLILAAGVTNTEYETVGEMIENMNPLPDFNTARSILLAEEDRANTHFLTSIITSSDPTQDVVDNSNMLQAFQRMMITEDPEQSTTDSTPNCTEPSSTMLIPQPHQPSSSISAQEIESHRSFANSIFIRPPTKAEITDTVQDIRRFKNADGLRMLINDNPECEAIIGAFQILEEPKGQEAIESILGDQSVLTAVSNNPKVQDFVQSDTFLKLAGVGVGLVTLPLLENGSNPFSNATKFSEFSDGFFSVLFKWLFDNIGSIFGGLIKRLIRVKSPPNPTVNGSAFSATFAACGTEIIIFVAVFILLTVIVKRVIDHRKQNVTV